MHINTFVFSVLAASLGWQGVYSQVGTSYQASNLRKSVLPQDANHMKNKDGHNRRLFSFPNLADAIDAAAGAIDAAVNAITGKDKICLDLASGAIPGVGSVVNISPAVVCGSASPNSAAQQCEDVVFTSPVDTNWSLKLNLCARYKCDESRVCQTDSVSVDGQHCKSHQVCGKNEGMKFDCTNLNQAELGWGQIPFFGGDLAGSIVPELKVDECLAVPLH